MTPPAPSRLAIVVVSFDVREALAGCLESITAQPPALPHEIVVVDNGSSDGSGEMVRARWPGVRVIALGENRGFAAANNVGIRETAAGGSTWVLLLNSDTVGPAGALDRLVARAEALTDAAVAGPRLVDGSGRPELSFGPMPSPVNEARQKRLWMA